MRVLVTGGTGQLGAALRSLDWPESWRILTPLRSALDLSDRASIQRFLDEARVDAIINAGAYTNVDRAESEPELAWRINAEAPAFLAAHAESRDLPMLHVSTDYVFDGGKVDPYIETDPTGPLGVYGASKLGGEKAVSERSSRHAIIRTSWVVSATGRNFLRTMLRLGAERPMLRVVDDQWGAPTFAPDLAQTLKIALFSMLHDEDAPTGLFHFSNKGETSWKGFADAIFAASAAAGGPAPHVEAIPTSEYPTPARRPLNSRLATQRIEAAFGINPAPWRDKLPETVQSILSSGELVI
jgi:dTDP-4-dehydrorhamnose reductase